MRAKNLLSVVLLAMLVFVAASHAEIAKVDGGIEFAYYDPYAASVSVAGIFNDWNMNANPMTLGDDGTWRAVIDLGAGSYEYKFVVNGSQWVADPDNPKTAGDYGNSLLVVGDDGDIAAADTSTAISNTQVNSRVRLEGWYRASYDTESEVEDDPTWRLTRPDHEVFISVVPTVTDQVTGRATLRFYTGEGEVHEVAADLYDGRVRLEGSLFSVMGFYNEEVLQFDEPFELVGHRDLAGTIPEEHVAFGRGAQGMIGDTGFWGFDLTGAYTNTYDADIYNDPDIYDRTGTDLLAARLTRPLGPVTLGATYASWRDGWWIGFQGTNTSPHLDEYLAESGTTSDWFEMANTERFTAFDVDYPINDQYGVKLGYALYGYESKWDMGNFEKVNGDEFANGAIDVVAGDMNGSMIIAELSAEPVEPLDLDIEFVKYSLDGMEDGEEYTTAGTSQFMTMGTTGWGNLWPTLQIRSYTEVSEAGSPLTASVLAPIPEIDGTSIEFDGGFGLGIFDLGLEYDRLGYNAVFTDTVAMMTGTDELDVTATRFAGSARANIIEDRLWFQIAGESRSLEYDPDESDHGFYDTMEAIFSGGYSINQDWSVLFDVRHVTYKDVPTTTVSDTTSVRATTYDDESFMAPYVAVVFSPRPNVQLRVGYGVDPLSYIDSPVEGRENGRERWRSNYMWEHGDASSIDAEEALADARTIGIMALITF